jgi:EmrB/QacA subfamily drug resistance transporter
MTHAPSTHDPSTHALAAPDPRRWRALVLLCLAQFMVILDVTVVNVALPVIGRDLALDRAALTWVVTAYTLCFGGLMLLGGRLADAIGRRRTFLTGLGLFTIASLASGLAGNAAMLVASRAAQGAGAALLSPAALSMITTSFHGAERRRALGVWAAIGGGGAAVGVLLGGALAAGPGWQWVFFINVPVGIAVAAGAAATLTAARRQRSGSVDLAGALIVTSATGLLIYGLVRAGDTGWGAAWTLVPLAAGLALAAMLLPVERAVRAPLVRLELLTRRPLVAGTLLMLATSGLLLSSFFLSSLYLQRVLGFSALRTGLVFLPVALAITLGAHLGARAVGRLGPRPVAAVGFALAAVGAALLSGLGADGQGLVDLLPGFLIAAGGLGATLVTATTTAMAQIDPRHAGMTSGLINTCHELGAALGVAFASTIASSSVGTSQAGGAIVTGGFGDAFLASAVVAALVAVAALWLPPPGRPAPTDEPMPIH